MALLGKDLIPFLVENLPTVKTVKYFNVTKLRQKIRITHQYIQQAIANADFEVIHMLTGFQKAYIMIKGLGKVAFERAVTMISMTDLTTT